MMKKIAFLISMAFVAMGINAAELKIGENDSQTYQAPVYVTWADKYYCSQILYTADELGALDGQQITKLTFFLRATTGNGTDYENIQIRLKEVEFEAFEAKEFVSMDDVDALFVGTFPASTSTTLEAPLSTPFVYKGGTLLVDVRKTEAGGGYAPSSGNKGRFQATYGSTYTVLHNYDKDSFSFPVSPSLSATRPDILLTYEASAEQAIELTEVNTGATKRVENGRLVLEKNGVKYNALGATIK